MILLLLRKKFPTGEMHISCAKCLHDTLKENGIVNDYGDWIVGNKTVVQFQMIHKSYIIQRLIQRRMEPFITNIWN